MRHQQLEKRFLTLLWPWKMFLKCQALPLQVDCTAHPAALQQLYVNQRACKQVCEAPSCQAALTGSFETHHICSIIAAMGLWLTEL